MKYVLCGNCRFWVESGERQCPNCGISKPGKRQKPKPIYDETKGLFYCALILSITASAATLFLFRESGMHLGLYIPGFLLGLLMTFGLLKLAVVALNWGIFKRYYSGQTKRCLKENESAINQRLRELEELKRQIRETKKKTDGSHADDQMKVLDDSLDVAIGVVNDLQNKYRANLWDIALIRWQNTMEPLAADIVGLSHKEYERRLETMEKCRLEGNRLASEWESQKEIAETSAGHDSIERLRESLANCEQLHRSLIARQANVILRNVNPLEETTPDQRTGFDCVDLFNARAAIGEFSVSFEELETEYIRLQLDEDASNQIQNINSRERNWQIEQ